MAEQLQCFAPLLCFVFIGAVQCCKSDPRDAMFVSRELGRGINHFFKNCSAIMLKMKPYPSASVIAKFIRSLCDGLNVCEIILRTEDMQKYPPCLEPFMWAQWIGYTIPIDQMEIAKKTILCGIPAVSTVRVARHALAYGLKITG
ncbi:uncharacterized protein LOC119165668 [Rhipicephalus microplus]|uniref:uncharacterized protein LOC119165668 n=1 Tax=Rhipicephalus microplus TaxID=6941 RepID=UPI003F6D218C